MQDEDERWFDALAGRSEGEGASLRSAILAQHAGEPIPVQALDAEREATLILRARRAGLLDAAPAAKHLPQRRRPLLWASLAAALAIVAVGISGQFLNEPAAVVLRGDSSGVLLIRADDPLALKQDLIRDLQSAGIHVTGYEKLGRQGLDADLPAPLPEAVRDILQRRGIPVPMDNILQLEIEAASPQ